jgi:hypothetical protein
LILPPSHLLASKWVRTTVFRLFRPGVQSSEKKCHIYFCWLRIGISSAATWLAGWLAGRFLGTIFVPTHILQTPKIQKLTACGF